MSNSYLYHNLSIGKFKIHKEIYHSILLYIVLSYLRQRRNKGAVSNEVNNQQNYVDNDKNSQKDK